MKQRTHEEKRKEQLYEKYRKPHKLNLSASDRQTPSFKELFKNPFSK